MQLIELEMLNFCQFRHRTIAFGPGLTAIIGPNGSGKSNTMNAIVYALVGILRTAGTKLANICQGADATERSFVRLRFRHNNAECEVTRYLRPDNLDTTLTITGESQVTGDRRVTERILNLLDIDTQILNDIVVVAQGELFGFLARTPAKRAEAFARIFRLERAKIVHKAIQDFLSDITLVDVTADLASRREELSAALRDEQALVLSLQADTDIAAMQSELARLQGVRAAYNNLPTLRQSLASSQATLTSTISAIGAVAASIQATTASLATSRAGLERNKADTAVIDEDITTLQAAASGCKADADKARSLIATIEQRRQIEQQRASINQQMMTTRTLLAGAPPTPPVVPFEYDKQVEKRARLNTLIATKHELTNFINSFDPATGVAECPTCHTPASSLADKVKNAKLDLPNVEETIRTLESFFTLCQTYATNLASYNTAKQNYDNNVATWNADLARLQTQLGGLGDVPPPDDPEEVLRNRVLTHDNYLQAINDLLTARAGLIGARTPIEWQIGQQEQELVRQQQQYDQLVQTKSTTESAISQMQAQINSVTVTPEQLTVSGVRENWLAARIPYVQTAQSQLATTRTAIQTATTRIMELEAQEAESTRMRNWVTKVRAMRDLLHHDAAPKFVMQRNLELMAAATNDNLSMWDASFRVSAMPGLTYLARFIDGREQPAERLSGGQQVVLAMVFRLALLSVYADIGFLGLDEPTAYLDEHHIAGFEPALGRLREFAVTRGLQCLLITHEERLAPLFDAVIRL